MSISVFIVAILFWQHCLWSETLPLVRVLVVTGGHDFEEDAFFSMLQSMKNVASKRERFSHGAERYLTPEKAAGYDVAVFYDMHQTKEPHSQSWLEVLRRGKPTVFLHHALGSYVDRKEYGAILGGHANFSKRVVPGVPNSTYQHDVAFRVHVADPAHPITAGMKDFDIVDEIYNHYEVKPGVHILLTAEQPGSGKVIAWTHRYERSPIVYVQLGHDHTAYENPNFRRIVERSILWAAGRLR